MATNYAHASYTEVVDMQTVDGKLSIVGIHTPVGKAPYLKLKGFFRQFSKYRYKGISNMTIVPASGLPIDPLGLSVQTGSTEQMNPLDTFNPMLFKGCHGEHLHNVLDVLMDDAEIVKANGNPQALTTALGTDEVSPSLRKAELSLSVFEANYYKWLTDTSWRKFGIQSVAKIRNLHPLVWKMARNLPLNPSADADSLYNTNAGLHRASVFDGVVKDGDPSTPTQAEPNYSMDPVSDTLSYRGKYTGYVQEFTNGCARLGWLPTTTHVQGDTEIRISALPKLFMGVLVLPPSYSTEQFMRCVIRHEFEFRDFTSSTGGMDDAVVFPSGNSEIGTVESGYVNWIDYATSKGATLDVFNGSAELRSDGVS